MFDDLIRYCIELIGTWLAVSLLAEEVVKVQQYPPHSTKSGKALIHDFYQVALFQLTQKRERILFALGGFDIVFIEQLRYDGRNGCGGLDEFPDARSHGIEAVVNAVFQVQNRGFALQIARHLIVARFDVSG